MKQKSLGVKARKRIGSVVYHCFMVLLSLTMIYPFVWSVLSSFKTSEQLYGGSPLDLLPKPATLYNYERLFQVLPVRQVCRKLVLPRCGNAHMHDCRSIPDSLRADSVGV